MALLIKQPAVNTLRLQNVDPSNFSITNTWPWNEVVVSDPIASVSRAPAVYLCCARFVVQEFAPAVSSLTDFTFTVKAGKKSEVLKYSSDTRNQLLCDLQRYCESRFC
jgi:hypothetical protein